MTTPDERIRKLIMDQACARPEEITDTANLEEDLGMDQLDTIELIMEIEEEYALEIPEDDAKELTTVGSIIKYVKDKTSARKT